MALGFDYLRATGAFDVGQAIVVAGRHVLTVEAAEGTDQMLARVAEMRANGRLRSATGIGVLVKGPKVKQDQRFDLPSIGPQTIEGVTVRDWPASRSRPAQRSSRIPSVWWSLPIAAEFLFSARPPDRIHEQSAERRRRKPALFLVAGEELRRPTGRGSDRRAPATVAGRVRLSGVGGAQHGRAKGLPNLFPLGELAIIGFGGIPSGLPKISSHRRTADAAVAGGRTRW